jgi:hypothetical protein
MRRSCGLCGGAAGRRHPGRPGPGPCVSRGEGGGGVHGPSPSPIAALAAGCTGQRSFNAQQAPTPSRITPHGITLHHRIIHRPPPRRGVNLLKPQYAAPVSPGRRTHALPQQRRADTRPAVRVPVSTVVPLTPQRSMRPVPNGRGRASLVHRRGGDQQRRLHVSLRALGLEADTHAVEADGEALAYVQRGNGNLLRAGVARVAVALLHGEEERAAHRVGADGRWRARPGKYVGGQ